MKKCTYNTFEDLPINEQQRLYNGYACFKCRYSTESYRPEKDKTLWCYERKCNMNKNDVCPYWDEREFDQNYNWTNEILNG